LLHCQSIKTQLRRNTSTHVVEISTYLQLVSPRTLHTLLQEFLLSCKSVKSNLDPHIVLRCEIHTRCELWWFLPARTPADIPLNSCSHFVVSSVRLQEHVKRIRSSWMDRLLMKITGISEMSLCSWQATPRHVAEGRNLRGCPQVPRLRHRRFENTAMQDIFLFA